MSNAEARSGSSLHRNRSVSTKTMDPTKTCFLPQCPRHRWTSGTSPDISGPFKGLLGLKSRVFSPPSGSPFVNYPLYWHYSGPRESFPSPGQQALGSKPCDVSCPLLFWLPLCWLFTSFSIIHVIYEHHEKWKVEKTRKEII